MADLLFVSNLRLGFGGGAPPAVAAGETHAQLVLETSFGAGLSFPKTIALAGPGEVGAIVDEPSPGVKHYGRRWPSAGATIEPNAFPYVELLAPDLPWRYSVESVTVTDPSGRSVDR